MALASIHNRIRIASCVYLHLELLLCRTTHSPTLAWVTGLAPNALLHVLTSFQTTLFKSHCQSRSSHLNRDNQGCCVILPTKMADRVPKGMKCLVDAMADIRQELS
ncbi:hypothetical protein Q1695_006569 [Nippostrongylus brasiliensis]|nr:hypothetical protein Q1695_006569 [Nippostrongylus brasiliensis]